MTIKLIAKKKQLFYPLFLGLLSCLFKKLILVPQYKPSQKQKSIKIEAGVSLHVTFVCWLKTTSMHAQLCFFYQMSVEHMQIGNYRCNKVALKIYRGIVVNHYFFSERNYLLKIFTLQTFIFSIGALESRSPNPPVLKLRNSQFVSNGPNWKILAHTLNSLLPSTVELTNKFIKSVKCACQRDLGQQKKKAKSDPWN